MSDSDDMSANSALREPQMSIDSEGLHTYLEASATALSIWARTRGSWHTEVGQSLVEHGMAHK